MLSHRGPAAAPRGNQREHLVSNERVRGNADRCGRRAFERAVQKETSPLYRIDQLVITIRRNGNVWKDETIQILLLHRPTSECCPDCHVSNGDVIPHHKGAKGEVRVDVRARSLELGSVGEDGDIFQPFVHLAVSDRSATGQQQVRTA